MCSISTENMVVHVKLCVYKTPILRMLEKITYVINGDMIHISVHTPQIQLRVTILLNNNFESTFLNNVSDNNGNILGLHVQIEDKQISLVVLYGPSEDIASFYEKNI